MFTAELNWVEVLHTCCCGFGVFWLTTKFTPLFFFNFTIFFFFILLDFVSKAVLFNSYIYI